MYTVYYVNNVLSCPDAIGYWRDDTGKVYEDKILYVQARNKQEKEKIIENLFTNGELAAFVICENIAGIYVPTGVKVLHYHTDYSPKNANLEDLLNIYGGCTLDIKSNRYTVWYN